MDIVLGVSIAPASVQMVMLQGESADGPTIDENEFAIAAADDSPTASASDRVIAAIMCTREDAAGAGLELDSIGVACTDQLEAAVLRDALAAHKIENVMLVSAFVAAAALTQSVGGAMGYERTAMLFVEPDTATLAVVETSDGSVDDVHKEQLDAESAVTAELMELVAGLDELPIPPGGLFVVGSGVDTTAIRRHLEGATSLIVNVPEEPETALARGAALASAHARTSTTGALAYAQDPGTGAVEMSSLPEYLSITHDEPGEDDLAYSAVDDDEADAPTMVLDASGDSEPRRRPGLLVGTGVAIAGFSAALALEVALSLGIQTTAGSLPAPIRGIIAPVQQALLPAPEVAALKVEPKPLSPPPAARPPAAPVPAAPPVLAPAPVAVPAAPAPAVPVPVFVPPIAPAPVPPIQLPDPPASPPVVEAPPHSSPPIYVPPPKSPPHRPPPEQSPPPSSGGGGPASGPGPVRGNPGSGGPGHGGGPAGGPGHGTPGGGPNSGGPTTGGGGPTSGGGGPNGGPPAGGGPATGPGHGAPSSGGPTGGGGTPANGGGTPSGGAPTSGGEGPSGGGPTVGGPTGGGETPSGSSPTGGGASESSGGSSTSGGSSSSGESSGGSSLSGGSESSGGSSSSSSSSGGSESSSGSSSSSSGSESSSSSSGSSSSAGH